MDPGLWQDAALSLGVGQTPEFTEGSGNVFADLGIADTDVVSTKAKALIELKRLVKAQELSRERLAQIFGMGKPAVGWLSELCEAGCDEEDTSGREERIDDGAQPVVAAIQALVREQPRIGMFDSAANLPKPGAMRLADPASAYGRAMLAQITIASRSRSGKSQVSCTLAADAGPPPAVHPL